VFVSPRVYLRKYTFDLYNFLCTLPTAVARFSSGGVANTLCTSDFIDDVILAHKPRQLNVAAQLIEAQHTHAALDLALIGA